MAGGGKSKFQSHWTLSHWVPGRRPENEADGVGITRTVLGKNGVTGSNEYPALSPPPLVEWMVVRPSTPCLPTVTHLFAAGGTSIGVMFRHQAPSLHRTSQGELQEVS